MKLSNLKPLLNYDFDMCDTQVDVRIYIDIDSMQDRYLKQIEVTSIDDECTHCDFTDFLSHHKTAIRKFLNDNYFDGDKKTYLIEQLCKSDNITSDGGEAVYYFIRYDLTDFLSTIE